MLDEGVAVIFLMFCLRPGHRKGLKSKSCPAMDTPVHGEPYGVMAEDCIHKLIKCLQFIVHIFTIQIDHSVVTL